MRFGQMRGVMIAVTLVAALAMTRFAAADGFVKTIPREVLAQDLNTGQPYFAPPVPWGHYAKDGAFDHFYPKASHLGFLHRGCKSCGGAGSGHGGNACDSCKGSGCGLGKKCGLGHGGHGGDPCGDPGCGLGHGSGKRIKDCGLCKNKGCGLCRSSVVGDPMYVTASNQSPITTSVVPITSTQAGPSGQFVGGQTMLCDSCIGKGCGKCKFGGLLHKNLGDPCGGCGSKSCGGKCGLFGNGGFGHGLGGHDGGSACGGCGGKGCGLCGLGSNAKGKLLGLLHHKSGKIKYFVGPGGPVPLTPGYVPYTITTRSPRDFLAFPPYTPSEF